MEKKIEESPVSGTALEGLLEDDNMGEWTYSYTHSEPRYLIMMSG
jgi:hypothetical protein